MTKHFILNFNRIYVSSQNNCARMAVPVWRTHVNLRDIYAHVVSGTMGNIVRMKTVSSCIYRDRKLISFPKKYAQSIFCLLDYFEYYTICVEKNRDICIKDI